MLVEVVVHSVRHRMHDQVIGLPFDNQPALREEDLAAHAPGVGFQRL